MPKATFANVIKLAKLKWLFLSKRFTTILFLLDIIANLVIISTMKRDIFAIVGPTASGKSDMALSLATKLNSIILSVDSLSVYKEIDIASAKPSKEELEAIKHFGIDILYPNQKFDVIKFVDEFTKAKEYAKANNKGLIIVGGSSFYLKVLTQGISYVPKISKSVTMQVKELLKDIKSAFDLLLKIDPSFAKSIKKSDRYRIQKALELYFQTNTPPSIYFKQHPPKPIEPNLDIYEIQTTKEELLKRVELRTTKMLKMGLIDEVAYLEKTYTRAPNSMKAIGIIEVLDFLDGRLSKNELKGKIVTNTMRLAKRQKTFNKTQLNIKLSLPYNELLKELNLASTKVVQSI